MSRRFPDGQRVTGNTPLDADPPLLLTGNIEEARRARAALELD
jgi:hypothetical protein